MRISYFPDCLALTFFVGLVHSLSEGLDHPGTFQNPSPRARPRFRYWVPYASVELDAIRRDISEAAKIGAGGVELVGYYNYGNTGVCFTAPHQGKCIIIILAVAYSRTYSDGLDKMWLGHTGVA